MNIVNGHKMYIITRRILNIHLFNIDYQRYHVVDHSCKAEQVMIPGVGVPLEIHYLRKRFARENVQL
jgi:hypothetical protein